MFSDDVGDKYLTREQHTAEAKLLRVCNRLAGLESELRSNTIDLPRVAADIVASCQVEGEARRSTSLMSRPAG